MCFSAPTDAAVDDWPRDVEVSTADPLPTIGGWRLVARATLAMDPGDPTVTAPKAEGRFIRPLIRPWQRPGAPRTALGHLKVFLR